MPRKISEDQTRKEMIDPQLEKAGWYLRDHADRICFLRAAQSVFLQKRHLETADASTSSAQRLYEPPLNMFGADAVERWFTEKEVIEVVEFANRMAIK
jgi:type I site-specific restriction endonuclease